MSHSPSASDEARGYLHGGLFIDFIGQKGPISKFQLIAIDLVVVVFQIIMLGVVLEKERTKRSLPPDNPAETPSSESSPEQDHDAEERGVRRTDDNPSPTENGI